MLLSLLTFTIKNMISPHSAKINFSRQILTTKVDPHTVRVNIVIMVVDPLHRYSNEPETAN